MKHPLFWIILFATIRQYIKYLHARWLHKKQLIEEYEARQPRYRVPRGKRLSQVLSEEVAEQSKN